MLLVITFLYIVPEMLEFIKINFVEKMKKNVLLFILLFDILVTVRRIR